MNTETSSSIDLDSILDLTIDDLADMPEFKPFPPGAHQVTFDFSTKVVNEKAAVQFDYTYVKALELVDSSPEAVVSKVGDTAQMLAILKNNDGSKNEFSEGLIKMHALALRERFPGANVTQIFEAAKGAEIMIVTGLRENKKTGVMNMTISAVHLV